MFCSGLFVGVWPGHYTVVRKKAKQIYENSQYINNWDKIADFV